MLASSCIGFASDITAWGADRSAPWVVLKGAGAINSTGFISAYPPHSGRPKEEWRAALHDLRSSLDAVRKITSSIVLGGDLNVKNLMGNPTDDQGEADTTDGTRGLWGNRLKNGMDATDISRGLELEEALDGFDLRHHPHSGRLQPKNYPYQRAGTPAILDYFLSSAEDLHSAS